MLFSQHRRFWWVARSLALFAVLAMLFLPTLHRMSMQADVRPLFCTAQGLATQLSSPIDSAPAPMSMPCKICVLSAQFQAAMPALQIAIPLLRMAAVIDAPLAYHSVYYSSPAYLRPPSHAPPRG